MKKAWITLQIDHGSGQKKDWCKVEIPISEMKHLVIWDKVEKYIKELVRMDKSV